MADEELERDSKPPPRISLSPVDLARRPLSVSLADSTEPDGTDSVVDLTGDSTDEEDEVVDLTSPMDSRTFISIERDGLIQFPRAQHHDDHVIVEHVTLPLPSASSDVSNVTPRLPTSLHSSNNVTLPTRDNNSDDDVIIVSSYNILSSHTHIAPPISPSTAPLSPHISRIVTCPICMESQKNFTMAGSQLVATKCGHLFCDGCLKKAISLTHKCPTCSSKLTAKQFHRIYL